MRVRGVRWGGIAFLVMAICGSGSGIRAQQASQTTWADQDIGKPAIAGSATSTSSGFSVTAGGSDIWGTSDQFHFVYQQVSGDVDVRARVDSLTNASSWSKAGVMIRGSLAANAAHGFALVSAASGTAFQRRTGTGALSTNTAGPAVRAPEWVRVVRQGSTVSAYTSSDGSTWSLIGSDTIQLSSTAYVGLAVTSHNTSASTTASFSQISVTPVGTPVGLPAGQLDTDIGSPAIAGAASYASGTYQIHAGGTDVWGTADQFHFVYQPITGDVDVSLRVDSISAASSWSKAGVMIRETLDADSAHGYALLSAGNGYSFQRRPATGDQSLVTAGSSGKAPGWVRLTRTGALLTAYQSSNGTSWTVIGSDSIPMADTVYVGIAVTSHNASTATSVTADSLKITALSGNQPPAVSLTSPAGGATFTAPASIAITANASDPQNQLTKVEFYNGSTLLGTATAAPYSYTWNSVPAGTYSLTAIAYDSAGLQTTSSPVSITVNGANQPPTVSISSPAGGATFTAPASIAITATASDPQKQLTKVEFYNGSTLLGSDTASPYTFTWSSVAAGTYSLTAVAYDAAGLSTRSAAVSVTVTASKPPTVSLTSPSAGATFTAPASITMTASASDPQNQLTKVEFYNGSTLLGSDTASPYTFTWSSVAAGTYSLTAVAYDGAGLSTRSAAVSVTVKGANQPPTVALTSPASGASFTAPASITITASASDPQNQLTKVEFYNGSTLLGTATGAPYTFTWSSVAAGTYSLSAIAYDAAGLNTRSAAVSVTVNSAAGTPPTGVSFTASSDNASVTSYRLDVFASGADPNTATPVATMNAGKPTPDASNTITVSAPSFFSALAPGNYQLTVSAISANGVGRSAPILFTR